MGTATIISGGEAGKYMVTPGRDKGIDRQSSTESMLEEIEVQIADAESDLQNKLDALESAAEALNDGLADKLASAPLAKAYQTAEAAVTKSRAALADLKARRHNLTAENSRVTSALAPESKEIWCADLTEDLTGEAGTAEVNGVPGHEIIMPGGGEGLGLVQSSTVSTAAAIMSNWALLPAWQRHKPTYRIGTLTDVDYEADTCSLTLDAASASLVVDEDGDLGTSAAVSINPDNPELTAVPIGYMTCDAAAFKAGDRVLVRFIDQDWSKPEVTGFENNPQPCGTGVPVEIYDPDGNPDFVTFANLRISDLQQDITYATYMRDVFIPEIIAYYQSLEGKYVGFAYGIPWVAVTQERVDRWQQPAKDWRDSKMGINEDLGYNSYVATVQSMISRWTAARDAALYADTAISLSYTGCLDDGNDESGATIGSGPVMYLDCPRLSALNQEILSPSAATDLQNGVIVSAAAEDLWARLDTYLDAQGRSRSPVCQGHVYVTGLVDFGFESRAVVVDDYLVILSRDFSMVFPGYGVPETTEFTLTWADGSQSFRFPSPHNYCGVVLDMSGEFGESEGIDLSLSVSGRLPVIPSDFGGEVEAPEFVGNTIHNWGGPKADDPYSWVGSWLREYTIVPQGFEIFAGRYPDHPIVTGRNVTATVAMTEEEENETLAEVNDFVNSTYSYIPDGTNRDYWQFLSAAYPSGDCEDFALTKIQMLIDRGIPISKLHLQAGVRYESYSPQIYDTNGEEIYKEIGHVWVLVDNNKCLNNGGAVTTPEAMAETWQKVRTQTGLSWEPVGSWADVQSPVEAVPWHHVDFLEAVITMKARIKE